MSLKSAVSLGVCVLIVENVYFREKEIYRSDEPKRERRAGY